MHFSRLFLIFFSLYIGSTLTLKFAKNETHLGYFLRGIRESNYSLSLSTELAKELDGLSHYRLLPGSFPSGMGYHFDGLATVMSFRVSGGRLTVMSKYFKSEAEKDFSKCIFFGSGTGPTLGLEPCFLNPGVNLLPINGQLWLTIDTSFWGRMDPETLETIDAKVDIKSTVLNAHPACDPRTGECFVQYPCSKEMFPVTNQACVGKLTTSAVDLMTEEVSRITLPSMKTIQHSHSPCVTENYVVIKLDSFGPRFSSANSGLLKLMHQVEDNLWMVYDRQSGSSRLLSSGNTSFVNNHFWNCYEKEGMIVVDSVSATEDYLDSYFQYNLDQTTKWTKMFQPPYRCYVPVDPKKNVIECEALFPSSTKDAASEVFFDYPTFNPLYKMNNNYNFFYAISTKSNSSKWFDKLIKVDAKKRIIVNEWSKEGIFFTEADYVPRKSPQSEDDGFLLSVIYNQPLDKSCLAIFFAQSLQLIEMHPLDQVIPFHAHGISCMQGKCFSNP